MARTVSIGNQDFESLRLKNSFYVDKTGFIREWWESEDVVTLITRPRRFGKTLTLNMLEKFFSVEYAGRADLFDGLAIWKEEKYRSLQGTYPVLMVSFADVKENTFAQTRKAMCRILRFLYDKFSFLLEGDLLSESEKKDFRKISAEMEDNEASFSLKMLSLYLSRYYGKKVIILLDEYDTPMQEAYLNGYWEEMVAFTRNFFNATFKTNPYLERAVLTGITRISRESMFSDLNNLEVVSITSGKYVNSFGFTEEEVFTALGEFDLSDRKEEVKSWYDGFVFGSHAEIYNPWSIINYLDKRCVGLYWVNTSSNSLAGSLIQTGNRNIKMKFEDLLQQRTISSVIDDEMIFNQLDDSDENAVWSLLFASGYLKAVTVHGETYELKLTNYEVRKMFETMVRGWFGKNSADYNDFIKALLLGDLEAMNEYMNRVALTTFSYFDTGNRPSGAEPERFHGVEATTKGLKEPNPSVCFYHGFVLGLMVELADRSVITSNRESGFGRYDVILKPRKKEDDAFILEFKVHDPDDEKTLQDTVEAALKQIEDMNYKSVLMEEGICEDRIRKYGFGFEGKRVLIG